ncbi:hypothetical protein PoMZ_02229 [Pyricularia oryzae]|uniref:Uncharacterized protein n=1 Tax=Pyricularia oryzae TaxID=318829 RepID=A0A4V1C5R5_PYROR|nr:hypothetical protein PoMZ_02229 [Pyricularia oryzae]
MSKLQHESHDACRRTLDAFFCPMREATLQPPHSCMAPPLKHCDQTEMANLSYKILGRSLPLWSGRYTKGPRPDNSETAKTSKRCFDDGGRDPRGCFYHVSFELDC